MKANIRVMFFAVVLGLLLSLNAQAEQSGDGDLQGPARLKRDCTLEDYQACNGQKPQLRCLAANASLTCQKAALAIYAQRASFHRKGHAAVSVTQPPLAEPGAQ